MSIELLIGSITLFVLSIFLGVELITKVPAMLHTPLMSGANAISGISVVGALLGANVAYEGGETVVSGDTVRSFCGRVSAHTPFSSSK